jgi:hypothetical protein
MLRLITVVAALGAAGAVVAFERNERFWKNERRARINEQLLCSKGRVGSEACVNAREAYDRILFGEGGK